MGYGIKIINDEIIQNLVSKVKSVTGYAGKISPNNLPNIINTIETDGDPDQYIIAINSKNIYQGFAGNGITNISHMFDVIKYYEEYTPATSPVTRASPFIPMIYGEGITDMSYAYRECNNLNNSQFTIKIGNNVKNISYAFYNCISYNGKQNCSDSVEDMSFAFCNCVNMIGPIKVSNNATNLNNAFFGCLKLNGSPKCPDSVVDMSNAYCRDQLLTGSPVCGNNVKTMDYAYYMCYNLSGRPVCGPNVTNMYRAYSSCGNLTGLPVCGDNVIDLNYAYYMCSNITGAAACGPKVEYMTDTYTSCIKLQQAVCGPNVKAMANTYLGCWNIKTAACGENVVSMVGTYHTCLNLTNAIFGNNVMYATNAYANCTNLLNILQISDCMTSLNNAFEGCIKLNCNAPILPNKIKYMEGLFKNCYNLKGEATLPYDDVDYSSLAASYAYDQCRNITSIKEIYTNSSCRFFGTFNSCANVQGDVAIYCGTNSTLMCGNMFNNCCNINNIVITGKGVSTDSTSYYKNMFARSVRTKRLNILLQNGTFYSKVIGSTTACGCTFTSVATPDVESFNIKNNTYTPTKYAYNATYNVYVYQI